MTARPRAGRQEQARTELAVTAVRPRTAWALTLVFLATLVVTPVIDLVRVNAAAAWVELGGDLRSGAARLVAGDLRRGNRQLLAGLDRVENRVEELSVLRRRALPVVQWILTRGLGVGNEQAYLGLGHWLFYRADVDHVTGPGFLDPERLAARRQGGDAWEAAVEPDPRPALAALGGDLAARGIDLVLLPTPVKTSVHPERFTARAATGSAPRNASFAEFLNWAVEAGLEIVDPLPALASAAEGRVAGEARYLATDTHWTPASVKAVAELLAERIGGRLSVPRAESIHTRAPERVAGRGDIVAMLRLPDWAGLYPPQEVETQRVVVDGRPWRSDAAAEVLLLGDSFTNIYSDPALGWGAGAGLAEQLSFTLERPVDRLALNAGGARAAREALLRTPERLEGKRLVVYQFAVRELSQGDWPILPLPAPAR
jgi:alginate O-acetyltransferase complex protein AlgJ